MKLILFVFLVCVLGFCVKSETQCIEYNKIRALLREEIQNFQNPKISKLESMVMTMNEYSSRHDRQIRIQKGQIHEQQRRIQVQEIQIRNLHRQLNEVGNQIAKLEGKSNSKERKKQLVHFYGYMSNGEAQPGKHQILVFDVVRINVGLALIQHSGMFTAPVYGVFWTVVSGKNSYIYSQLVINSDPFGVIQTDSDEIGGFHAVTGTVVAELNQGDDVYIPTHPTNDIKGVIVSQDDMRTSFSG